MSDDLFSFKNYEALEKHFDHAHHPCPNSSCQARKFVVFGSLLDLQAHMVEEHGAEMTPRDKKIAQRVNAGFEFQESAAGRRRGPREREPPPHTQRRDRFGGHLTTDGGAITTPSSAGPSRRQSPSPPPADMDPVTFERQNALYARLRALAPNPTNALAAVKLSLRSYLASESAASDLISTVWNILDRDLDNTASIVNLLVDLVDDEEKKTLLLGAWNGFKIEQRRQFPDLVPTAQGNNYAGVTGGRVLNIKQSTATRSSRRPSRAVWDRVAQAASSAGPSTPSPQPPERFPTLQPSAPSITAGYRQTRSTTAWSASASGHAPPAPRSVPATKASTQPAAPKLSSSLFPELPSASSQRARPVAGGKTSLQKILGSSAPATSAWAPGASSGTSGETSGDTAVQEAPNGNITETVGKKKGKGKQKQTLFTLGSFPT
ncbi:hypothetical protein EWM64_g6492 [Hericium alpestre]|uniref:C2H2-type domain-containing protein n=1 Tax=Hericium alpestre TaxID=135208 RepID=A0A4Y9ZTI9_9AGAM|nr:hypothetical protein EWM64_g6492 [Hericium alpestre]